MKLLQGGYVQSSSALPAAAEGTDWMFGQYASFIIPSYLVSAAAILFAIFLIRRSFSNLQIELAELQKAEDVDDSET